MNSYLEILRALDMYGRPCLNNEVKTCTPVCPHYQHMPSLLFEGATRLTTQKKSIDVAQVLSQLAAFRQEITTECPQPLDAQLADVIAKQEVAEGRRDACWLYPRPPEIKKPARKTTRNTPKSRREKAVIPHRDKI